MPPALVPPVKVLMANLRTQTCKKPNFTAPQLLSVVHSYSKLGMLDGEFRGHLESRILQLASDLDSSGLLHEKKIPSELNKIKKTKNLPFIIKMTPDLLFLYKPPGYVDDHHASFNSLRLWLQNIYFQCPIFKDEVHACGLLHRLDTMTSGVLMVARNYRSYYLNRIRFSVGEVEKEYICLVHGKVTQPSMVFTDRLLTYGDAGSSYVQVSNSNPKAKHAHTEIELVRYCRQETLSLLKVRIATGRTHQIRVHLANAGFPIVGDRKYGPSTQLNETRLFLHAHKLDGVECPLSEDLQEFLNTLDETSPRSSILA
jgi:23S rRNA-/tRNA-specific pseudouridylate synthase